MRRIAARTFAAITALVLTGATAVGPSGCSHASSTIETHPLGTDIGAFRTCSLEMASSTLPDGEADAPAFVSYLEGRLRERGVLEPVDPEAGEQPDLLLKLRATDVQSDTVKIAVDVIEAKTNESLGEIESTGKAEQSSPNDAALIESGSSPRRVALHHAADAIADYLRTKRGSAARGASIQKLADAKTQPVPEAPKNRAENPFDESGGTPPAPEPYCRTMCTAAASSHVTDEDLDRLKALTEPHMKALRACLDRVGASLVEPALLLKFGAGGRLAGMRVDMGGFEDLMCVDGVRQRPPRGWLRREGIVRCSFHCS